ncbi:MAG TPA: putative metalloprotease CJM1_0395 family protein [Cellvibrio sp.]|nr:putative metalloprotease CJM1_0395 family protein [Cellvibrio sp.]
MINSIPSVSANTVAPFAPLGRQPVGLESAELKSSSVKALEQSSNTARSENRRGPDYRPNEDIERERVSPQERQSAEPKDPAPQKQQEQKAVIAELVARDREVRSHEQAHAAAGGQYAGSPTYSFVKGPDGLNYAVGGEVSIDTAPVSGDPEATIRKAQIIRAAASAPAEPSPQDRRVAAQAATLESDARIELAAKDTSEVQQPGVQSEEEIKARKLEARQQAEQEEELRKEIRRELDKQQADLNRSNQERAAILAKSAQATFDITRRLVEIGAVKSAPSVGSLLNSVV